MPLPHRVHIDVARHLQIELDAFQRFVKLLKTDLEASAKIQIPKHSELYIFWRDTFLIPFSYLVIPVIRKFDANFFDDVTN